MYVVDDDFDDQDDGDIFFPDDPLKKKRLVLADFLPKANISGDFDWGNLVAAPKAPRLIVVRMDLENLLIDDFRIAVRTGKLDFVTEFLRKSKLPVDTLLKDEWTALLHAASSAQTEVLQFLLQSGADPNLGVRGYSPIMAAVCCTNTDCDKQQLEERATACINLLVQSGAKVNTVDAYGTCALHFAAKNNRIQVAKCLIANKAKVNQQDTNNDSAMHVAAKFGHGQLLRLLLESGADLNLTNNYGLKAEDTAIANGFSEIGELLIRYRTDHLVSVQQLEKVAPEEKTAFSGSEGGDEEDVAKVLYSDLQVFLQGYRLPDLEPVLMKHNITQLPDVLKLRDEDLDKMGVLSDPKERLMKAINSFSINCMAGSSSLPVPKKHISSPDLYNFLVNVSRQLKYIESSLCAVERSVGSDPGSLQRGIETIPPNAMDKQYSHCRHTCAAVHTALSAIGKDLMSAKKLGISRPGLITEEELYRGNKGYGVPLLLAAAAAACGFWYTGVWKHLSLK